MRTADFDFVLPPELVAQQPLPQRDQSRLLVLHRQSGNTEHRRFRDLLQFLRAGDVLVLNNSRVIPARLRGVNAKTGGMFEMLLLEENATNDWWTLLKPGRRARIGTRIEIRNITATVADANGEGHRRLRFSGCKNILSVLDEFGEVPLPPYVRRGPAAPGTIPARGASAESGELDEAARSALSTNAAQALDRERYQTVFAKTAGSVAAPTAGLHFTEELLDDIRALGVEIHFVTLHVGLGTFAPVKTETLEAHIMHAERFEISEYTASAVNRAKSDGRRVIAVGTTSVRVLESAFRVPPSGVSAATLGEPPEGGTPNGIVAGHGRTRIFIRPPHDFQIVDALLTNFHVPCSTLLMLVSAFAAPGATRGRELILSAYAGAIRERYRFFSYGDAMLLI